MPKAKPTTKSDSKAVSKIPEKKAKKPVEEEKIVEIDTEDKIEGVELVPGSMTEEDEESEDDAVLDDDEVDPFKDKWEE